MIKCIIVDDDLMARKSLERYCGKMDDLILKGSCENVDEALDVMNEEDIDLIFLDIEMPGSSGFDLLDQCTGLPNVIVTSAKEKYAFEAFQYEVDDYLKKPIRFPRFKQAVDKVSSKSIKEKTEERKKNIFIKSEGRYINLLLENIHYIENVGDYVKFVLADENHVVHGTIKGFAQKMPAEHFMKVHRSFIVNLSKIVDIEDNSLLVGRKIIPVSRANKSELMERLNLI